MRTKIGRDMVIKEIEAAKAQDSLANKKLKWATMQGYYSMFHCARALLYNKGYGEKNHFALSIAVEELFSKELGLTMVNAFRDAMDLRQEADCGLKFSEAGATETIETAEKLLARVREILKVK